MHLVYERMFPLATEGATYANCEAYYAQLYPRRAAPDKPTKHDATVDLVKAHVPAVASNYRLLKDACHNAATATMR